MTTQGSSTPMPCPNRADCTTDCGWCKGAHLVRSQPLRQWLAKATWGGHHAHGGIPFDQKAAWADGYNTAKCQLLDAAGRLEAKHSKGTPDD
jgi:hypothetical protein